MSDFTLLAAQGQYLIALTQRAVADLEDSHCALEPAPGVKTAGWLIGHLAVTGDFARRLCGRPPLCPREWRSVFNPGSHPSHEARDYPSMQLLRETLLAVYTDLCSAAPTVDPVVVAVPNPFVPGQAGFPTAGEFVGYLLTGHLAYHLGQLVIWRAAAGLPAERPAEPGSVVNGSA
jgi:DinB family protein